jgi:hypothetical protein
VAGRDGDPRRGFRNGGRSSGTDACLCCVLQSCGTPASVVPGASGSCSLTVSDTNAGGYKGQVDVAVALYTTSNSGGRATGSGVGTEALLDGQPDALQATVIDTTTNQQFDFGTFTCYKNRNERSPAAYPNASYCASSSRFQTVATNVNNASFSNNFVIHWWFPPAAGNPYQCGRAKIILQSAFTGTVAVGLVAVGRWGPAPVRPVPMAGYWLLAPPHRRPGLNCQRGSPSCCLAPASCWLWLVFSCPKESTEPVSSRPPSPLTDAEAHPGRPFGLALSRPGQDRPAQRRGRGQ